MKKIYFLLFVAISVLAKAQGPVIEGTYLPVRGTAVKEVWNKYAGQVNLPAAGQNITWDYSSQNSFFTDTFLIKTMDPDSTDVRFHQYFPTATHASYLRTPFNNISDSLYSYYLIDTGGLHMLGGFNVKQPAGNTYIGYDTTAIITPSELYVPNIAAYGMIKSDTSYYTTYGVVSGFPVQIRGVKVKTLSGVGYGTLTMPNGAIFNDVLLTKINVVTIDSGFISGGTYTGQARFDHYIEYSFLRNNTFGSSSLMYFNVDSTNTTVNYAWYTLPVDFGAITGTVYDSLNEAHLVTHGAAYLYRENSNFAKNDILATDSLDANGNFRFDGIPYGLYRIAIRPDLSYYPNALTTYYGDSINWLTATELHTFDTLSNAGHIHLQYHPDSAGQGQIHGTLNLDQTIRSNKPIPGIDVVVKKKPSGSAMTEIKTDSTGAFDVFNLFDGNYELFVDIPGLHMTGTYEFSINGTTNVNCLDFTSGTDSIHPTCQLLKVPEYSKQKNENSLTVYPNPYSDYTNIKIDLSEKTNVIIEVYTVLGEKIHTIDQGEKQKGTFIYNFSAKKLNYSSGIYFIQLKTEKSSSIFKIIEL